MFCLRVGSRSILLPRVPVYKGTYVGPNARIMCPTSITKTTERPRWIISKYKNIARIPRDNLGVPWAVNMISGNMNLHTWHTSHNISKAGFKCLPGKKESCSFININSKVPQERVNSSCWSLDLSLYKYSCWMSFEFQRVYNKCNPIHRGTQHQSKVSWSIYCTVGWGQPSAVCLEEQQFQARNLGCNSRVSPNGAWGISESMLLLAMSSVLNYYFLLVFHLPSFLGNVNSGPFSFAAWGVK